MIAHSATQDVGTIHWNVSGPKQLGNACTVWLEKHIKL